MRYPDVLLILLLILAVLPYPIRFSIIGASQHRVGRPACWRRPCQHLLHTAFHRESRSGSDAQCSAITSTIRTGVTANWLTSSTSVIAPLASRSTPQGCVSCAENRRMKRCMGDANGNIGCPRRSLAAIPGDSTPTTSATITD